MSRLSPHIQAMRAEAEALREEVRKFVSRTHHALLDHERGARNAVEMMLRHSANAKDAAANALEEWERKQMEGTHG